MGFMSKKNKIVKNLLLSVFTFVYAFSCLSLVEIPEVLADSGTTYAYTGKEDVYTASKTGEYQIEVWGASGGGASLSEGGMGGYSKATIKLLAGEKLYIHTGQKGEIGGGTTYGGGASANNGNAGAGGGASWVTRTSNAKNYVEKGTNLLVVAGGGGGKYSGISPTEQFRGGWKIGSGAETPNNYHPHSFEPGDIFGHDGAQVVSNNGTIASSSTVGGGAGGGGYIAGGGGDAYYYGGLGGQSYINAIQNLYNTSYVDANHIGNGQIRITYIGNYNVTISLILNNNGIFNNGDYNSGYKQTFKMTYPAGSSVYFPAVTPSANIAFNGYKFLGEHENCTLSGTALTLGLYDVTIQAEYTSTGISFSGYKVSDNTVHLDWHEEGANYYIVSKGADSDGVDTTTNGYDTLNVEDTQTVTSTPVTLVNSTVAEGNTWIVPSTGFWQITAYGQKGGNTVAIGNYGSHSGSANGHAGASASVSIYLKEGQKVTYDTSSYRGGSAPGGKYIYGTYIQAGNGGNGIGVKVDGSLVLVAGGGGGAVSALATESGCHFGAYSGGGFGWTNGNSTYGANGINKYWTFVGDAACTTPGGGGGGKPGGGVNTNDSQHTSYTGQCWRIGSFNGKDTESYSASDSGNNSTSFKVTAQLVKIGGGTTKTSGNYGLTDKKGPFTPTATADGGYHVEGNEQQYTISWNAVEDQASQNNFVVSSFTSTGSRIHTSQQISFNYASGLSHYVYSIDHSSGTKLSAVSGSKTVSTVIKVPFSTETKYVHIAAVDKAGNVSDTLTITLSGNKTIYYSGNGLTDSQSWNDGTGTYKYTTDVQGISPDSVVLQDGESHTVTSDYGWKSEQKTSGYYREGYHHTLSNDESQKFVWNTKPDGTGRTYYTGDTINYDDFDGSITLYAMWTPNTYTVTFDGNTGTMLNPGVYLYNSMYSNTNTITVTFNKTDFNYMYGDIPTKTGYHFLGWYDKKQNNTIGNGNQSITGTTSGVQVYKGNAHAKQGTKYWNTSNQWTYAGDVTVYAGWASDVYKITLNKDKATNNGTSEIYLRYDDGYYKENNCTNKITSITIPSRTGWNFFGYYTKIQDAKQSDKTSGTGNSWKTRDGYWETFKMADSPIWIDKNGNIKSSNVAITGNTTLYAYMRDNIKPTATISYKTSDGNAYTPGTWTQYSVTVTVTASDSGTGIQGYKWVKTKDEGNTWTSDTSWTSTASKAWNVTTRSYGTVSITDNAYESGYYTEDNVTTLNVGTSSAMILVDKTKPYFSTDPTYKDTIPQEYDYNTKGTSTCKAVITMPGTDDHSGVNKYIVTNNGNVPSPTNAKWQTKNTWDITVSGWYYCWVMDKVGNISDGFKLYIDLTAPTMDDVYTKTTHNYTLTYTDEYSEDFTVKREQLSTDKIFYYPWVNNDFRLHFTAKDEANGTGIEKMVIWKGEKGTTQAATAAKGNIEYIVKADENEGTQIWTVQVIDKKGNTSYIKVATRIDSTVPAFVGTSRIDQPDIKDIKSTQIENYIKNADNFKTTIETSVSDYKTDGVTNDTSGIRSAYVDVMDTSNTTINKSYQYTDGTASRKLTANTWENHIIEANYKGSFNLFADFPDSNQLCTYTILVDNAGNISINGIKVTAYKYTHAGSTDPYGFETTGPKDPNDTKVRTPDDPNDKDDNIKTPYDNDSDGGLNYEEGTKATPITGGKDGNGIPDYLVEDKAINPGDVLLQNFSIMTYLMNDQSSQYNVNVDTGNVYFRLNEKGHVVVYTIGYVQDIQLDFLSMGQEAVSEIQKGLINPMYNMGVESGTYERHLSYSKGTEIVSTSPTTGDTIQKNSDGVPFAMKYDLSSLYGSNGTAILIPPYYEMQDDTSKPQNSDGSYPKKWEKRYFKAIANKTNKKTNVTQKTFDKNSYILWSDYTLDVHYRVTHES